MVGHARDHDARPAAFVVYATWRAFENAHYYAAPYLSPFYSPCVAENCTPGRTTSGGSSATGGRSPRRCSSCSSRSGFRLTCYYYRKAYYRSFWLSPPACAVAEPHATYTGETRLPADPPELAPLLLLRRRCVFIVDPTPTTRSSAFRVAERRFGHRRGHRDPGRQRRSCCGSTRCRATPAATSSAVG